MSYFKKRSDIQVGVIGYGGAFNMGRRHLEQMKKAGMKPVAVTEIDAQRLEVAKDDFPGIETYGDVKQMLKNSDVNLVTIITPHNTHAPLATQCIKAGRHVVTEKPFCITTAECDKLIKAAEKHDVMVSTYHNRHWDGCILTALKKIKQQGAIGDVFRVECHMGGFNKPGPWWRTSKSISGGILYDWGVHLLEYALQIVDSPIVEVSGFAVNGVWETKQPKSYPWHGDANEDDASVVVRFANGTVLHLHISSLNANPRPHLIDFYGTKGCYTMGHTEHFIHKKTGKELKTRELKNRKGTQYLFYQNIADYLVGEDELVITPQWARRPIHILDLAGRSAKQGKALKPRYD